MASNSAVSSISATLSTTTVDTCTLTGDCDAGVRVWNLTGTTSLYVTIGGTAPAAPTAGGDNCFVVPAGIWRVLPGNYHGGCVVKVIGNANAYVVEAV